MALDFKLKKLDLFIIKQYIVTFFFCLILFTIIAIAVDTSEKADDFVQSKLSSYQIFSQYFIYFVPWIWGLLFPLFSFIAVIFFTSRLSNRSEVIAILASGVSYNRFLRPFFIGGTILAFLLWVGGNYIVPKANVQRTYFQNKYVDNGESVSVAKNYDFRLNSNTYMTMERFDTLTKKGYKVEIDSISNNQLVYKINAGNMEWDKEKKIWRLKNVLYRTLLPAGEKLKYAEEDSTRKINLQPSDMVIDFYQKDKMTTPALRKYIKKQELKGVEGINSDKVEYYRRLATAISIIILTMIGAMIASRKTRGGSGLHIALGIIFAAVYIIADKFSTVFAIKADFPPILAAWVPNIFFILLAIYVYRTAQK